MVDAHGAEVALDKNVGFALVGKGLAIATDKMGSSFTISTIGLFSAVTTGANSGYAKTSFALYGTAVLAESGTTCVFAVEEPRKPTNDALPTR